MSMRLGIGTYAYAWSIGVPGRRPARPMTARDLVERAAELGVHVVQICDNLPLHALSEAELDALARLAERHGVQVEVGTRGILPEHLRAYLRLAERFRSPILRVVVDTADHKPSPDEVVERLRPMRSAFETAGVTLAIENHDRFAAAQFRAIVEALGPWAGICLDTVNSFGALEGPAFVVETLAPRVVNLHVKDFAIARVGHQMGFVIDGRPAGEGRLDVPWLLERLRSAGATGNAILELWPAPEASIEQTVRKEDQWVRRSVAYLRTLIADGGSHP